MKSVLVFLSAALALASSVGVEDFAASSKLFSAAVYDEISENSNDNILFSPFSVITSLALTQTGAVGLTGEEIRKALFLPATKEDTEAQIRNVLPTIHSDQYTLKTANKVYVEKNYPIKDNFQTVAKTVYEAAFESVDFAESLEAAAEINAWVEENTNDKIHGVVSPDDLDASTIVVLVNALYFQGNWSVPFNPETTLKTPFYAPNDKIVQVDTMHLTELYNFYESTELDAKFLEIRFLGQEATLTVVLPNKIDGIGILEKQGTSVLSTPDYTAERVVVALPKFKIEAFIPFKGILQKLGIDVGFSDLADFSGIAGVPGDLRISMVSQKTFIDVNEWGVEAAAATAIGIGPGIVPPPATQEFIADHPFLYYIKVHDIVLFQGRVLEPNYE